MVAAVIALAEGNSMKKKKLSKKKVEAATFAAQDLGPKLYSFGEVLRELKRNPKSKFNAESIRYYKQDLSSIMYWVGGKNKSQKIAVAKAERLLEMMGAIWRPYNGEND